MMHLVTPESVGLSSTRLQRIDAMMQRHVQKSNIAGGITLLARRGQIAHLSCTGQMDIASQRPMQEDTIFRIFSMTKQITTLAVLMLYEEGHFQLSTPIAQFMPAFKEMKVLKNQLDLDAGLESLVRPITIHDLLTHTSGLGYGFDPSSPVEKMYADARIMRWDEPMVEKIPRITALPLHHQPGLRHTYSIATDVLGHLVELISDLPLDEFFKQRIFTPLGMVDTDFYVPAQKLPRLATLYTSFPDMDLVDLSMFPGDPLDLPFGLYTDKSIKPPYLMGGAGLVSTAADYYRFVLMLRNQGKLDGVRLLSRKTIELMTAVHLRNDKFFIPGIGYGLGVVVITNVAEAQVPGSLGAYGGSGAANTEFWYDPVEDLLGLLMLQFISYNPSPVPMDFKVLAMQVIDD
jgi:CubicO group peptidase (beta-lactamase class C family)